MNTERKRMTKTNAAPIRTAPAGRAVLLLLAAVAILAAASPGAHAAQTIAYAYDALGRLIEATYDDTLALVYEYDASGNLTRVRTTVPSTDVASPGDDAGAPLVFALAPTRPNPARGDALVRFQLPRSAAVAIEVFDTAGRRVRTLAVGEMPAGRHAMKWDGTNDAGRTVASGVYFVRFESPGAFEQTRRVVMLR